jgi:hypothetical protein
VTLTQRQKLYIYIYRHTQNNGAVLIVNTIKTAPFFGVCPVYEDIKWGKLVTSKIHGWQ